MLMPHLHLPHKQRRLGQRGDTIVEVLIAIAVVSLVLVAAYATTTRNVATMQDTAEHSQALQLAQAQLEFLHNAALTPGNTCYTNSGGQTSGTSCIVDANGNPAGSADPAYQLSITTSTPVAGQPTTYAVSVTWASLLQSNPNNITLYYQR